MQRVMFLELWRWCFFGSGLAPVWYLSALLIHCLLISLEAKLFTVHQALYFAVAMKVPAELPLKAFVATPTPAEICTKLSLSISKQQKLSLAILYFSFVAIKKVLLLLTTHKFCLSDLQLTSLSELYLL